MPYQILLYYLYTDIENPQAYRDAHYQLCAELDLVGRIIVAKEGINGTVSGTAENCRKYREAMQQDTVTADIVFKIDPAEEHVFPRLSVKVRNEIVTLGLGKDDFSPVEKTAYHMSPEEWQEAMQDDNTVIIDARNKYEWQLGHFKDALLPEIDSFRELPKWIENNRQQLTGKKILTYCTGGVRCEKFSGFLLRSGFTDVSQLDGGVVNYSKNEKTKGMNYEGQLYVFDQRIGVDVNRVNPVVVSSCAFCLKPSERYVNCAYKACNAQHFCCASCEEDTEKFCSKNCDNLSYSTKAQ